MSNRSRLYRSLTICLGGGVLLHPIQSHATTQAIPDQGTASQLVVHPVNLPDLYLPPQAIPAIEPFPPEFSTQQTPIQSRVETHTTLDQGAANQIATRPLQSFSDLYRPLLDLPQPERLLPKPSTQQIRLVIRLKQRRVDVYKNRILQASYPIAIGKPGWETPTGKFQVIEMQKNPGWTHPLTQEVIPPGPDNPLGERWIAFWTDGNNYIGLHGTPSRESIGKAASHGCVRMYNEHVRELYELVKPGTLVTVKP
ncbi:MAG: L,D-transpeptidase [Leptolyngbyaceae cyanobacterium RU_5_1]|nr:L,D-transpeptidase [Leptolyngbyaceae cyanobacterium RU_5_1]